MVVPREVAGQHTRSGGSGQGTRPFAAGRLAAAVSRWRDRHATFDAPGAQCAGLPRALGTRCQDARLAGIAMTRTNPFERDLDRNPANYTPLSPLSLIARAAYTYPQRLAVVHGERRYTWAETYARCRRLASALAQAGVGVGDTVALMAANTPEMVEAHFGVPMTGGVLNTLNTRLDAEAIAFMLEHGEAKVLDHRYRIFADDRAGAGAARGEAARHRHRRRAAGRAASGSAGIDYEAFIAGGDPAVRMAASGRRMERDLAQLHVGHDRQSEGRGLPSPRRVSQRAVEHHRLGHAAARACTCGRCRCSTATAGASSWTMAANAGVERLPAQGRGEGRSSTRSARTRSRTTAARRSCTSTLINAPGGDEDGHRPQGALPRRRRARRRPR